MPASSYARFEPSLLLPEALLSLLLEACGSSPCLMPKAGSQMPDARIPLFVTP